MEILKLSLVNPLRPSIETSLCGELGCKESCEGRSLLPRGRSGVPSSPGLPGRSLRQGRGFLGFCDGPGTGGGERDKGCGPGARDSIDERTSWRPLELCFLDIWKRGVYEKLHRMRKNAKERGEFKKSCPGPRIPFISRRMNE